jgi:hypothetical protein
MQMAAQVSAIMSPMNSAILPHALLSLTPAAAEMGVSFAQNDPPAPRLRAGRGFNLPPLRETWSVRNDDARYTSGVPTPALEAIAARHRMTRVETKSFRLPGRTLHRWWGRARLRRA